MALTGAARIAVNTAFAAMASISPLVLSGCATSPKMTVTTDIKEVPGTRLGGTPQFGNGAPNFISITGTYSTGNTAGQIATGAYVGLYSIFAAINGPKGMAHPALKPDGTPATARELREIGCERDRDAGTLRGGDRLFSCPEAPGYLFFIVQQKRQHHWRNRF